MALAVFVRQISVCGSKKLSQWPTTTKRGFVAAMMPLGWFVMFSSSPAETSVTSMGRLSVGALSPNG